VRRFAITLAIAVSLAACGPSDPELRLRAEMGRELIYEAHRVDDWPDEEFGYGGVLDTRTRFRMATEDAVSGRGGRYRVVVEGVRVASPERFGVAVDTDTPDPEEGDDRGVEELARGLLRRHGEVTIAEHGLSSGVEPDQEIRDALKDWGKQQDDRQAAMPVMMVLDEILDGSRLAATWIQSASLLLPEEKRVADGVTWTRTTPPFGSPAGTLAAHLAVTQSRDEGRVTLRGVGDYALTEAFDDAPLRFVSGSIEATAVLDTVRGVLVRYEEATVVTFEKVAGGGSTTATWNRTLTLVE
jgi:hypothetical protein